MGAVVIIGAQWGDEGKGKIVDLLAESADMVVRYAGGPNAGHTLVVGDDKVVFRLVPSGGHARAVRGVVRRRAAARRRAHRRRWPDGSRGKSGTSRRPAAVVEPQRAATLTGTRDTKGC